MRLKKNYLVHDPQEITVIGDLVSIQYNGERKISERKAFHLIEVLKEGHRFRHPITGQVYTTPAVQPPAENWQKLLHQ